MKIHVMVATTQGLVAIQKIYRQDPDIRSVVSINGTTTVSPISAAYQLFVTKGVGIIENDFGGASYRVNIAKQIDQGNSWQLGFYLAHALEAQGELGDGQPQAGDRVICASGELNTSERSVLAVNDIALKIERADAQIRQWPDNIALQFILPKANGIVASDTLPATINSSQLHYVDALAQAINLLPKPAANTTIASDLAEVHPLKSLVSTHKLAILLVIIGAALALYAAGLFNSAQSGHATKPFKLKAPDNTIAYDTLVPFTTDTASALPKPQLRLGYSSSAACNTTPLNYQNLVATNNNFAPSPHSQLCDIRFYSQTAYTTVIAINVHSHRFVQASQQADEFIIPVPQSSTRYLLLGFTSVLKPATLKALHSYLFNLPEQHVLSEAELKQLPALADQEYALFSHQLTQNNAPN